MSPSGAHLRVPAPRSHILLAPGPPVPETGRAVRVGKLRKDRGSNLTVLPFTFLTIKGKIAGPQNVRMELSDYGQEAPRTPSTQLAQASQCVNTKPETLTSGSREDRKKMKRLGWGEGFSRAMWSVLFSDASCKILFYSRWSNVT